MESIISERYGALVKILGSRVLPEPGRLVGYAALIAGYALRVPLPRRLALATERERPQSTEDWLLIRQSRRPDNTMAGHLDFALRREGVELSVLKALFRTIPRIEIEAIIRATPTGVHTRRLWFLYEWLTADVLDLPDASKVKAVPILNDRQQVAMPGGELSVRHRVVNNLPGTPAFCPTVRWTETLRHYAAKRLDVRAGEVIGRTHPDVIARAAAFMLLKDSRSSFDIEGERPPRERIARWGQAIAQAGSHPFSVVELERLQQLLVDSRFVTLGLRKEGGFVGDHDRQTQQPIPEHISARAEDVPGLLDGIVAYDARALKGNVDPVIAAASVAFGFVYVHPFVDGNGRIHRWLIHQVLASAGFSPPNVVFPVSTAILREIAPYKRVLESYSAPLMHLIDWRPTEQNNVEVLNDTADYYRFFDATAHSEFLYGCVEQTVEQDLPDEIQFLEAFDRFAAGVQNVTDMPNVTVSLLHKFLVQGHGKLSRRARENEFAQLSPEEVRRIEELYTKSGMPTVRP
ncbi:MAG: Fic family protein [Gemmatimonadota bacterium]|nr:Fic family protein [Gemmatimonadota bacterium]